MVKKVLVALIVLLAMSMVVSPALTCVDSVPRRIIPAIVSTRLLNFWLKCDFISKKLVVLDIRATDAYVAGHIPGAINVPDAEWYINDPFTVPFEVPWMEMPPVEDLFKLIGDAGITKDSWVVVVGSTSGLLLPELPLALYATATITRVAITLLYAGVTNVAILDGGYDKWVADGYPTETGVVTPTPVTYTGKVDESMVVSTDYVYNKIGKSIIVDARDEVVYNCIVTEPWCKYAGHIPTAKNLPTPSLWNIKVDEETENAIYITYKSILTLWIMAMKVIGWNRCKEIIVYCGVGGYASTTYFILKEVLGYLNVKFYDGSAQQWTHSGMPVECP